jgi:RNA polymerase sigma-70 factor (ECF subfamily)
MGAGDQGALASFYERFSGALYGVALKMMNDAKESEDVLQDALIYIWRKAETYNPELSSPFSWAVLIVRNKAIDRLRSRRRGERVIERATAELSLGEQTDDRSAEEPFFREQREIVRSALLRLPEEQRQALRLSFFSGLTHEEIAEVLGAPLGTVKARVRRGLIQMRDFVRRAR